MRKQILSAIVLMLGACGSDPDAGPVEPVEEAWVRLPAVEGRPGAAYFTLNGGEEGDVLVAADSPRVATIELHESRMEGESMTMRPVEAVEVPARGSVRLAPRGLHAMLFGLAPGLEPGDTLPINLRFDSGRDVQVAARIVGAGEPVPFGETAE